MLPDRHACTPHGAAARPNGSCGWSAGPARGSSGVWQAGFSPVIGRQAVSPPLDGQTGRGATQELPGLSRLCGGAAQEHGSSRHALEDREQSSRILRWGMPKGSDPEGQLRSSAPAVTPSKCLPKGHKHLRWRSRTDVLISSSLLCQYTLFTHTCTHCTHDVAYSWYTLNHVCVCVCVCVCQRFLHVSATSTGWSLCTCPPSRRRLRSTSSSCSRRST